MELREALGYPAVTWAGGEIGSFGSGSRASAME
jgi:hypothetical protein